jgi:hypothetical protein
MDAVRAEGVESLQGSEDCPGRHEEQMEAPQAAGLPRNPLHCDR